jgi:hypothetical protein
MEPKVPLAPETAQREPRESHRLAIKVGQEAQIPPPTRVVSPLTTNPLGHAPCAPAGVVGHPKGTQKDSGRGSGSPLTRAFAGSKPHTQIRLLTCLCASHKARPTGPYLRRWATGERITQARQPESLASHMALCLVLSCSIDLVRRMKRDPPLIAVQYRKSKSSPGTSDHSDTQKPHHWHKLSTM